MINVNGETHNDLCVGIDLGTTNSVLATVNLRANGDIVSKVVNIERAVDMYGNMRYTMKREPTLPSCVYYNEERNFAPVVGNFAKRHYSLRPHLVAKSIKSQMGNAVTENLSSDIPDKTPAEVSAQILKYMLNMAAKTYHQQSIDDAVITVPASFDTVMRQATLKAAELAGITIRNKDGSSRPILLHEPQAVIYDFINQARNGEVSPHILDLSSERIVMVFDLGGGTLDITMHKISPSQKASAFLSVEDLAINRYTLLGGDDFDMALANEMFSRYEKKYQNRNDIIGIIERNKKSVLSELLIYAEDLKINLSIDKSGAMGSTSKQSNWDDFDDHENYPVGGNIGATGFYYDDTFTVQELENVWRRFMGEEFAYEDYKRVDAISATQNTHNIIFPILDVLKKCADKLGTDDFKIDAVLMNGGMSNFYMVKDRLKRFFGFEPSIATDPDQSVARGAAVYHYFLHKYYSAIPEEDTKLTPENLDEVNKQVETPAENRVEVTPAPYIVAPIKSILPDSLYLKTFGDYYEEIIHTGTTLPHKSKKFTGFKLPKKSSEISVPIARRDLNGNYKIIAKGNMTFPSRSMYSAMDVFVAFTVSMDEQQIIRMDAYTCSDIEGNIPIDAGTAEIAIAGGLDKPVEKDSPPKNSSSQNKPVVAPEPKQTFNRAQIWNILNNILDFCKKVQAAQKSADVSTAKHFADLIRKNKATIYNVTNPEDFAEALLHLLEQNANVELFKRHCIIIGRKIGGVWTDAQKRRFADICLSQVEREMNQMNLFLRGDSVNTKAQAIYALYMCASDIDLDRMKGLHAYHQFRLPNLYVHAMTKTDVDWVYSEFKKDFNRVIQRNRSGIQTSAHALGTAYRLGDGKVTIASVSKSKIVDELCQLIESRNMTPNEIGTCIIAIGLLCDRRHPNTLDVHSSNKAYEMLNSLDKIYLPSVFAIFQKSVIVAKKMIEGNELTDKEESLLLIKVDSDD